MKKSDIEQLGSTYNKTYSKIMQEACGYCSTDHTDKKKADDECEEGNIPEDTLNIKNIIDRWTREAESWANAAEINKRPEERELAMRCSVRSRVLYDCADELKKYMQMYK